MDNKDDDLTKIILSQLEKLDSRLDKVGDRLSRIENTLIQNTESLEYHIRRSDNLEKMYGELRGEVTPLLKAYTGAWGVTKALCAVSFLVGLAATVHSLF